MLRVETVILHDMIVVLNDGRHCRITELIDRRGRLTQSKCEAAAGVAHDPAIDEWHAFSIHPSERYQ